MEFPNLAEPEHIRNSSLFGSKGLLLLKNLLVTEKEVYLSFDLAEFNEEVQHIG